MVATQTLDLPAGSEASTLCIESDFGGIVANKYNTSKITLNIKKNLRMMEWTKMNKAASNCYYWSTIAAVQYSYTQYTCIWWFFFFENNKASQRSSGNIKNKKSYDKMVIPQYTIVHEMG